ncbi:glutamate--tRNA ligase [Leptospira sp. GIMC2001]|uniref:glutamate--tRNA ligase n=1 Tax=Leptospira sp. GIMC2001 TaxID=1513297 RepID=UPI00234BE884|nr:glutamate--tRNA ligase [Leptospira sp. GIMC2001]WCL49229.1 glutamate--tRNA ligase [Leptospira sp. GIMC2001]
MEVRTRFAPSPTGFLHVGGARTALFNYLYAKAKGGKFILRIEDTDRERSTEESFHIILQSIKWLGMNWDEGPGVGGEYGPYTQSERLDIYKKYTDQLLAENKAYRCFCTSEELEAKKKQAEAMGIPYIYDGMYANLTDKEIEEKLQQGLPFAVRFRNPNKDLIVEDEIQGKVKFDTKLIGDFIIVKSDGFPSYNYAVVIDDYLMKISHVIRGVGHLSNTPRQVIIGEAFGFPIPKWAHVSEIVGSDGKKLSKRAGATSILAFKDLGYQSEALVNYMALLGWTNADGREYLPGELESVFDIARCSKSPAMFDVFKKMSAEEKDAVDFNKLKPLELAEYMNPKSKLNWISNKYIRDTDIQILAKELIPFIQDNPKIPADFKNPTNPILISILDSIRVYLDRLSQAPGYVEEFFVDKLEFENDDAKNMANDGKGKDVILAFKNQLIEKKPTKAEEFKEAMNQAGIATGEKGKNLFMPIRSATTGKLHGLELPVLFELLGVDKILQRIQATMQL